VVYLKDSCSVITLTMPNIFVPNYNGMNDYMRQIEMKWATAERIVNNIKYYSLHRLRVMSHVKQGRLPMRDARSPNGPQLVICC